MAQRKENCNSRHVGRSRYFSEYENSSIDAYSVSSAFLLDFFATPGVSVFRTAEVTQADLIPCTIFMHVRDNRISAFTE